MGDISSTIYPVNGGLEDWAYGAGWDTYGSESVVSKCEPYTYGLPKQFSSQQTQDARKNIRAAIYIVETDSNKHPNQKYLGGRQVQQMPSVVNGEQTTKMRVNPESILEYNSLFDGHVNRNIRLALALIDLSKPYIEITSYKESDGKVEITWQVNGCYKLNEARIVVNGVEGESLIPKGKEGRCNYMGSQSVFTSVINRKDTFELQAIADQEFGESVNKSKVSPREMAGKPQLHLTRLRTEEKYEVRQGGRVLKGGKVIKLAKERCKKSANLIDVDMN